MKTAVTMPLICPHGHQWHSAVLGVDWDGAVFADKFCPTCSRSGRRIPFSAKDIDNMISDEQLAALGEDANHTAALIVIALRQSEGYRTNLFTQGIAARIQENIERVRGFLARMEHAGVIQRKKLDPPEAQKNLELFAYQFGHKVRLVRLVEE
jgi:hypothetical protein